MTTHADADLEGSAGTGQTPTTPPGPDSGAEQQKTFDADYVRNLRAEAATYRKELQALKEADALRATEAKAAEEKTLAAQQEWQKLATMRESERDQAAAEAKAKGEALERYQATVIKLLEERRKLVPKYALPLLDKLDPAEQLAYITDNEAEFTKSQPSAGFAPPKRSAPASAPATGRPLTL